MTATANAGLSLGNRSIPSLDGLRALAISLVVLAHLRGTQGAHFPSALWEFLNWSELGVRIFFVISGFLITHLMLAERQRSGVIDLRRFYLRRAVRIFPAYYVFLFAVFILSRMGALPDQPASVLFHALTYTSNYATTMTWQIGHSWSLSVEEQFYLLWPAALALTTVRQGWRWPAFALIVCPFVRLFEYGLYPNWVEQSFETTADALACGCLLAILAPRLRESELYRRLQNGPAFLVVPAVVVFAFTQADHARAWYLIGDTVANIGIASCIHWTIVHAEGSVGRILNLRPFVFLGQVSCSLYLWQQIFLDRDSTAPVNSFPLNLALALLVAIVSHRLIELPALRWRPHLERVLLGQSQRG